MRKPRAAFSSFFVALILVLLDVSGSQAVPPGDPGFCPEGYDLVARYDWLGDTDVAQGSETLGEYIFDSGEDIFTFGPDSLGEGPNAYSGSWQSEKIIQAFVLVSGHYQDQRLVYAYFLLGGEFQADFSNQVVMDKGISHIDFCTTQNEPPVTEHPTINLFLPVIIGYFSTGDGF